MGRKVVSGHKGKTGRLFINQSELCVTQVEWKEIAEEEEVTNSCSAGKNQYEYGNTHVEGSVQADWDIANNPYDDPPQLRAGNEYGFRCYIHSAAGATPPSGSFNGATGPYLECDNTKFNNIMVTVPAKGKVHFSFDFKTNGPYTLPTGGDTTSGD